MSWISILVFHIFTLWPWIYYLFSPGQLLFLNTEWRQWHQEFSKFQSGLMIKRKNICTLRKAYWHMGNIINWLRTEALESWRPGSKINLALVLSRWTGCLSSLIFNFFLSKDREVGINAYFESLLWGLKYVWECVWCALCLVDGKYSTNDRLSLQSRRIMVSGISICFLLASPVYCEVRTGNYPALSTTLMGEIRDGYESPIGV